MDNKELCRLLVTGLSSCGEDHHGNASLNEVRATPNLIKTLYTQTMAVPIPYFFDK